MTTPFGVLLSPPSPVMWGAYGASVSGRERAGVQVVSRWLLLALEGALRPCVLAAFGRCARRDPQPRTRRQSAPRAGEGPTAHADGHPSSNARGTSISTRRRATQPDGYRDLEGEGLHEAVGPTIIARFAGGHRVPAAPSAQAHPAKTAFARKPRPNARCPALP